MSRYVIKYSLKLFFIKIFEFDRLKVALNFKIYRKTTVKIKRQIVPGLRRILDRGS